MKREHMAALQSIVPADKAVTVWLTSGEKLTGTGFTWDVSGLAQLFQASGPPIVVDMEHIAAIQQTAEPVP